MYSNTKAYVGLIIALTGYLASPLYFRKIIVYKGHESVKINEFRRLNCSEELEEKFNALLYSKPIGFYYDTLQKEVYLNNYEVKKQFINSLDSSDFSKFLSISRIDNKSPDFSIIKQTNVKSLDDKFRHKIPLTSAKKTTLNISDGDIKSLLNKTKEEQTIKIERFADLNNDGKKEKLTFAFSYQSEGNESWFLLKLDISFAELGNKIWKVYDHISLTSQQIQGGLSSIKVFKLSEEKPPLMYIDTEFTTLTGSIFRSQLLFTTSNKNTVTRIISVD